MNVKTPPLTAVAKKPVINGRNLKFPIPTDNIAFTKIAAVKAPQISLATLPSGNADLEEGTIVSPAINPIPNARERLGLVRPMVIEYMVSSYVTISLGLAIANCDNTSEVMDCIKNADNALYDAKTAGRNRVVICNYTN